MGSAYLGYIIITAVMTIIGSLVSNRLKSKFKHYSQAPISSGLSGRDIAAKMLQHYGITDVKIVEGRGFLSDHYNPTSKTVSLSPDVYNGQTVAAAAVAAHECGHAIQHDTAYRWLTMRSKVVPMVQVASTAQQYLLMFALGAFGMSNNPTLLLITLATFAVTAFFSFVTLPVEFDASKRALVWLDESGFVQGEEYDGAKDALWWAAMTYVAAALSALVMFLYLLMRYMSASNRN